MAVATKKLAGTAGTLAEYEEQMEVLRKVLDGKQYREERLEEVRLGLG